MTEMIGMGPLELFVAAKPRREFNVGDKISTRYDGDI